MFLHVISSQLSTDVQDLMIYTSAKASDVASSLADNANNSPTFLTEVNNRVACTVFLHRIHNVFACDIVPVIDVQDLMIYTSAKPSDVASSLADNANNSPTFLTEKVNNTFFMSQIFTYSQNV